MKSLVWIGATALLVSGCVSSLATRDGVLNPQAVEGMECVAVLPFENSSGTRGAGEIVAQEVASALLTSDHFNVIQPAEVLELLALSGVAATPTTARPLAQKYGQLLGVQAVVVGSVVEFSRENLTIRTTPHEPVVGFVISAIATESGEVVWSSTASNFDYSHGLAIPQSPNAVLRKAVLGSTDSLVTTRSVAVSRRGLCAGLYATLEKGERPDAAQVAEITHVQSEYASGATSGATVVAAATAPLAPAGGSSSGAAPLPALPGDTAVEVPGLPPPSEGGLPPMPGEGGGDAGALPGLPDAGALPDVPGIPEVPDGGGPGEPELLNGGGLPDMPMDGAEEPVIASGPPPAALLKKLKGKPKKLFAQLYKAKPVVLKVKFPKKMGAKQKIVGPTKKAMDQVGVILKAVPEMRLMFDVTVEVKGKGATKRSATDLAEQQGNAMVDFIRSRHGIDTNRIKFKTHAKAVAKGKGKPKPKTKVLLRVLQFP